MTILIIFISVWIGIIYLLINAPIIDNNGKLKK